MANTTVSETAPTPCTQKERFIGAINHSPIDRRPVWLMRQAGRYMPEYQAVKEKYSFQEMCRLPKVAADVSMQPFDILGVDAVIVFNDILIPFEHMGYEVIYAEGGPSIIPPFRHEEELKAIHPCKFDETPPVVESIKEIRRRVGKDVPIIGFGGAPFTMAAYLVESKMSRNLRYIKEMVYARPDILEILLDKITETVIAYLKVQIDAGADVVQIFDTWAGTLSLSEYRRLALPYQKRIVEAIQSEDKPVILYVKGSSPFLEEMKESGAAVLSVDWITPLTDVEKRVGNHVTLQGNLDPTLLYASPEVVQQRVHNLLQDLDRPSGHIVNLGHGILPETPVENVKALVEAVKA